MKSDESSKLVLKSSRIKIVGTAVNQIHMKSDESSKLVLKSSRIRIVGTERN